MNTTTDKKWNDRRYNNLNKRIRAEIESTPSLRLPENMVLPTGSGETFVCLKLAYPNQPIVPIYDIDEATKYNEGAPLNGLVKQLAPFVL